MVFGWMKSMFAASDTADQELDPLWKVMQEMDPWLAYDRFQSLELTDKQRPLVKGLVDGSIEPASLEAVQRWREQEHEGSDIDALVFALQHALQSEGVTYLFNDTPAPLARFPKFVDRGQRTILFNDEVCHLQIASLDEFLAANAIADYELESLTVSQMYARMKRAATGAPALDPLARKEEKPSLTFERRTNADDIVEQPVTAADIAAALEPHGYQVTADDVQLARPFDQLGLYNVNVQTGADTPLKVFVWLVPAVEM